MKKKGSNKALRRKSEIAVISTKWGIPVLYNQKSSFETIYELAINSSWSKISGGFMGELV